MSHKYKLTYFDFPGRVETTRYIFHAAGIPFEDDRIEVAQDLIDNPRLYGSDIWVQAKSDSFVATLNELREAYFNEIMFSSGALENNTDKIKKFTDQTSVVMDRMNQQSEDMSWLCGSEMTWADLHFAVVMKIIMRGIPDILDNYPVLEKIFKNIESLPGIVEYTRITEITDRKFNLVYKITDNGPRVEEK